MFEFVMTSTKSNNGAKVYFNGLNGWTAKRERAQEYRDTKEHAQNRADSLKSKHLRAVSFERI